MRIRRALARAFWALSGWRLRTERVPTDGAGILIGAPHTSNWDFLFMLAICWEQGVHARFLGKHTLFGPPFGWFMRWLGGIPVDRRNPAGLVEDLVERVRTGERFYLVITPEGTRSKGTYWKSGFYRLARETGLPVTLGFVDSSTRTSGLGTTFAVTGDVVADMDLVRGFYADKAGIVPSRATEPRLRDEADGAGVVGTSGAPDAGGPAA